VSYVRYLPPETADAAIGLIPIVIGGLLIWLRVVPGETKANSFGDPPVSGPVQTINAGVTLSFGKPSWLRILWPGISQTEHRGVAGPLCA
jgi:hypothetical protein